MSLSRNQVFMNTVDRYGRLWAALRGDPFVINTTPDLDPTQDRLDRIDHAWINIFTEFFKDRGIGRERAQFLGRTIGTVIPVGVLAWITWLLI